MAQKEDWEKEQEERIAEQKKRDEYGVSMILVGQLRSIYVLLNMN